MAELKCGFYNAVMVDGLPDRTYNADEVNDFLEGLVSKNGIFATISNACQVLSGTGLQVIVKVGKGMVDNHWFRVESDITLDIEAADVILNRIDSVIVRHSSTDRKITLEIKKGTLATNPVAPTLTRTEEVYEICLANVLVSKNATAITQSNITDTRPNNEVCGWITGLIEQIDTTTLFNQYEDAQNIFINEKINEYNDWEATQQTNFDNWFNDVQNNVKATSLYREYQAVYTTIEANEQIISIPSSINYSNNSLDVLNVLINGMLIVEGVGYTINSQGTAITLTNALELANQEIIFVNKKSMDGAVAENVVVQVESLQADVNNLSTNIYLATGEDDNITLSNIVKDFLNGTGDYSGVADNASMKINVSGSLGVDSLIDNQMVFDFNSTVTSNRKIIIDFGNATINIPASPTSSQDIFAIFSCEGDVTIENANIKAGDYNATTFYAFHGGNAKNCKINIENSVSINVYGYWGDGEISNSNIVINKSNPTTSHMIRGIYGAKKVYFNNVEVYGSSNIRAIYTSYGIVLGNEAVGEILADGSNVVKTGNIE